MDKAIGQCWELMALHLAPIIMNAITNGQKMLHKMIWDVQGNFIHKLGSGFLHKKQHWTVQWGLTMIALQLDQLMGQYVRIVNV